MDNIQHIDVYWPKGVPAEMGLPLEKLSYYMRKHDCDVLVSAAQLPGENLVGTIGKQVG